MGPKYFLAKAKVCRYRPMKKFLKMLGSGSIRSLRIIGYDEAPLRAYFNCYLSEIQRSIQIRLGPAKLPGDPPRELVEVYKYINGTFDDDEIGFGMGWDSVQYVESVAERRWNPTITGGFDLQQSYPIFSHGNGDYYGYTNTKSGFDYEHESGGKMEAVDLIEWVRKYFGDYESLWRR